MLSINNLDITFTDGVEVKHAIKHLDLEVKDHEFITIIGANGSGKSTLLNCIAGSIDSDSGSINLDGVELTKLKNHQRAKYLGRVFQDPLVGTIGDMLVMENLFLASQRGKRATLGWGLSKKSAEKYKELLKPIGLGLEDRLNTKMKNLSGGQRQSITLLMATMNNPHLLLLDEHTAALDPETAKKVMELTERVVREKTIMTIMITHNMKDAIRYGDRLIMLDEGRIIYDISGEEKQKLTVDDLVAKFNKKHVNIDNTANLFNQ